MDKRRYWLVGQAPARSGDGRPFTGPSGDRLVELMGLSSYDQLAEAFRLENLITETMMKKHPQKSGDKFDKKLGLQGANRLVRQLRMDFVLVCVGRSVLDRVRLNVSSHDSEALKRLKLYQRHTLIVNGVIGFVYMIPHPSGANRHWNDPQAHDAARRFLEPMAKRALIDARASSPARSEKPSGSRKR